MTDNKNANRGGGMGGNREDENKGARGMGGAQGNAGRGGNPADNLSEQDRAKGGGGTSQMKERDEQRQFVEPLGDGEEDHAQDGDKADPRRSHTGGNGGSGSRSGGGMSGGGSSR